MKAVEAKACGIERYFAFVYPFFEEGKNNFGMMGREATPLRSFAAYAQMANLLADHKYLGDLRNKDKRLLRARVFTGDSAWAIVVLYTGRVDPKATVQIDLPVSRIEGIDGRPLAPTASGAIPVPDGMAYVWCQWNDAFDRADMKTRAWDLRDKAFAWPRRRTAPSPIILRFQWDNKLLEATSNFYRFRAEPPKKMPVAVRVFNLAGQPRELTVRLRFHEREVPIVGPNPQGVKVPAEGFADASWEADLSAAMAQSDELRAIVTAQGDGDARPATLDFELRKAESPKPKAGG